MKFIPNKKLLLFLPLLVILVASCSKNNITLQQQKEVPLYSGSRTIYIDSSCTNGTIQQTAEELVSFLNKIDTTNWLISSNTFTTNGIFFGLTNTSNIAGKDKAKLKKMSPEGYCLNIKKYSIRIVGNTDLAVQHGMYNFLEKLGCRFLTPAEDWTVIPEHTGIKITPRKLFSQPDFLCRRIWYANGLGVGHSPDGSLKQLNETYKKFYKATRQNSLTPVSSGHSYYSTFLRYRKEFEQHPEWAGMRKDGTRPPLNTLHGKETNRNWCYSNPELAELCLKDRIELLTKLRKKNPYERVVSMEPNDGSDPCYCEKCQALGNGTDQVVYLANYVARGIRKVFPDALVGILIYPNHVLPPENIKLEPNIIPSLAMAFNHSGLTYPELVAVWRKAGAKQMAIYEYFGVYEWDFGMPKQAHVTYNYIKQAIPKFFNEWGVVALNAQSQASWARYGPSMYLARKLLWDVNADTEKIYSEYFTAAFGKAAPQMRKLFDLWDTDIGGKLTDTNLAEWLVMMQQAVDASQNETPQIKKRIEDMMAYMHTVVLYYKARDAQNLPAETDTEKEYKAKVIKKDVEAMLNFVWRTRKRQIMQFWGFMTRLGSFGKEIHSLVWKTWGAGAVRKGTAEWMTSNDDYSTQEIIAFFNADLKEYKPILAKQKSFSHNLIPMFPDTPPAQNESNGYIMGKSTWFFYLKSAKEIKISLNSEKYKDNYISKAIITDTNGKIFFSRNPGLYEIPDKTLHEIRLQLSAGIYKLEIAANGKKGYFPIFEPPVKCVYEQSDDNATFNQYFTPGYFYVPKGTKTINIRNNLVLKIKAPDWDKPEKYNAGNLSIPVGDNDGKVWEILHVTRAKFSLLNVPPFVANKKENLLIPDDLEL